MENHQKFMHRALEEASHALQAGDFPVGCVLVDNGQVIASGRRKNSSAGCRQAK